MKIQRMDRRYKFYPDYKFVLRFNTSNSYWDTITYLTTIFGPSETVNPQYFKCLTLNVQLMIRNTHWNYDFYSRRLYVAEESTLSLIALAMDFSVDN